MTSTSEKMSFNEASNNEHAPAVERDKLMIEELRADPDYADLYLKTALEDINEPGGLGGFLIALRRVLEARGCCWLTAHTE